jgi:hypothetical protein
MQETYASADCGAAASTCMIMQHGAAGDNHIMQHDVEYYTMKKFYQQ